MQTGEPEKDADSFLQILRMAPSSSDAVLSPSGKPYKYKGTEMKWVNATAITLFHLFSVYCLVYIVMSAMWTTLLFALFMGGVGGFGVTGGAHRMWTHRSYKATLPLRIILLLCFAVSGQNSIYDWVRDHRVHHKFTETDADPHNVKRGFFFAHVGWLMMHKHPEVISRGAAIDMSDVLADPVVRFHSKFFIPMKLLMCFVLPISAPVYLWGETWTDAIFSVGVVRYMMNLNFTWLVNSAAHMWGNKPYDRRIAPTENIAVAVAAMGEGWHNYHHVFPWDYKAAELGNYRMNFTTFWIDLFASIGWAYDLKAASPELVKSVVARHGDGSHVPEVPFPPGD